MKHAPKASDLDFASVLFPEKQQRVPSSTLFSHRDCSPFSNMPQLTDDVPGRHESFLRDFGEKIVEVQDETRELPSTQMAQPTL